MVEMMQALHRFFSKLRVNCYPAGQVPPGAAFPLLTWEAVAGRLGHASAVTATVWYDGADANYLRASMLDQVLSLIPEEGARVDMPKGFLLVERGSDFIQLTTDPAHPGLLGGRIRLNLRRYGAT